MYTHLFSRRNKYYLFNTETLVKASITYDLYSKLKKNDFSMIDIEVLKALEKKHIIIESVDKYNFYNSMEVKYNMLNFDTEDMTLFIMPTTNCNFACPYCFEGNKDIIKMTEAVQEQIVSFINSHLELKTISLIWYGGEPLISFMSIKQIYDKIIKETNVNIRKNSIITNGYLINKEILSFFSKIKLNNIQITLDGCAKNHNKTRFLKESGQGTFKKIVNNIVKTSKCLQQCTIDVRVNIDKNNYQDFVFLYKLLHQLCNNNVNVYPGIIEVDNKYGTVLSCSCYNSKELYPLYHYYREHGCIVNYFPLAHKHGCFINNINSYIIGPRGELYKCPEDANRKERIIGSIFDSKIVNLSLWGRYVIESSQFKRNECKNCLCFPICSGGCGKKYLKNLYGRGEYSYCHPLQNLEYMEDAFFESLDEDLKQTDENKVINLY